jgi:hypothetical protein
MRDWAHYWAVCAGCWLVLPLVVYGRWYHSDAGGLPAAFQVLLRLPTTGHVLLVLCLGGKKLRRHPVVWEGPMTSKKVIRLVQ